MLKLSNLRLQSPKSRKNPTELAGINSTCDRARGSKSTVAHGLFARRKIDLELLQESALSESASSPGEKNPTHHSTLIPTQSGETQARSAAPGVASRQPPMPPRLARSPAYLPTCSPASRSCIPRRERRGGCTIVARALRHYHHTATRHIDATRRRDAEGSAACARSCIFTWRCIDGSCPRNDSEAPRSAAVVHERREGEGDGGRRGTTSPPPPPANKGVEETWLGCIAQDVGALASQRAARGESGRQDGRSLLGAFSLARHNRTERT